MLQLKVNGEFIDLGSRPVISIDEESPIFDNASIQGGYSFPFNLPITNRNRRIFQFPERIEKSGPMVIDQDFELFHSGLIRASGIITITGTDILYQAYLVVNSGDFAGKIKDKKLNEVDFGGSRAWVNQVEFTQEDNFTLFPIYNPEYLTGLAGYNWPLNEFKLNHYTGGLFVVTGTFAISPYPFISYVVKQIMNQYGFRILENVLVTDPELKKVVLYSSFDATKIETTYTPTLVQVGTDPFTNEPIEELVDVATTSRAMDTFDLAESMPDVLISDFILWLRNRFNIAFIFDKFNNVRIIRRDKFVSQNASIDITEKASGSPGVNSIELPSGFKLSWDHDDNDQRFDSPTWRAIDDNLEYYRGSVASAADLAAISEPGLNDIYYIIDQDFFMQYTYLESVEGGDPGYSWIPWSFGFQNYLDGDFEEEIHTGFSSLSMINFKRTVGAGVTIRAPYTIQPSNGIERAEYQPFSPRTLLYHGLQKDSDGNDIPLGSSDNFDIDGNLIPGANLTMKWEGEFGVYQKLWMDYLTWWMKRKQVNIFIDDPSSLEFNKKYTVDRIQYLLKKKTTTLSLHTIGVTECEFYPV